MGKALIIVDVQNDFCEGGALAVKGGNEVAAKIGSYVNDHWDRYHLIVATRDWHDGNSDNEGHFSDEPDYVDSWPVHCVSHTEGANFHPEIESVTPLIDSFIHKGMGCAAYSGFEGVDLPTGDDLYAILEEEGINEVHVVGLAFDYCVLATAKNASDAGFATYIITSMTASVHPGQDEENRGALEEIGVKFID